MGAISATQHTAFVKTIQKELAAADAATPGAAGWQDEYIRQYIRELEALHRQYLQHIDAVHELIRQYESLRKQTRIMLRKRLAAHKRQLVKSRVARVPHV